MSVKVKALTKTYGVQKAIDNISFEANEGQIVGFLGPNGAGKSTTMKVATTFIPPSAGTVEVCGFDVTQDPLKVREIIGYLPEHNPLYLDMFVHEYLSFIGSMPGRTGKTLKSRIGEMVELCGLTIEQNKKIGALSKGYRQRVGLAQALLHDPKVLILDEPTTGLDPNQILEIRNLIREVSQNKTVIFSTHIMQEVQALCERIIIINQGKIVADDKVETLKKTQQTEMLISVEFSDRVNEELLKAISGVKSVKYREQNKYQIAAQTETDIRPALFQFAQEQGHALLGLQQEETTLEGVFHDLTKDSKTS